MSASLVGSEMCIRDRRIGACELAISRTRTSSSPAFVGGFGICARSGAAVSYTHLTLPTICSV
eukprot:2811896-Alexandrium_andersonii.AAC.1